MNSVVPIPLTAIGSGATSTSRLAPTEPLVARWTFTIAWYAIVGTHVLLGILRLFVTVLHTIMAIPAVYDAVTVVRIPRGVLQATGWCMGVVAFVHLVSALTIMRRSWRAGRLTLLTVVTVPKTAPRVTDTKGSNLHSASRRWPLCLESLRQTSINVWDTVDTAVDRVFGIDGVFGVNGRWFFAFFDGLEALEILSQTYQAYQLSRFVQNSALNSLMVVMIALNCWLPPLLLYLMRKNQSELTRRLAVFSVDLVLDLLYAEVIPLLALLPIVAEYDWKIQAFPPERGLDDIWGTNSVSQARFVLVTSYMDLLTTLVPNINFLIGIQTVKSLLEDRSATPIRFKGSPCNVKSKSPQLHKRVGVWAFAFHFAAFVWAAAIVGLHIDAVQNVQHTPSCKLPLSPWRIASSTKTPCAVLYVNCYRLGIVGTTDEIETLLSEVELAAVTTLAFGHCSALELPQIIQQLSNVVGLETFNSTLMSWGVDASLTQSHHPMLHHVYFVHTNMTRLPDAIMHDKLPASFQYLFCYDTNLISLPDSIDEIWGLSHKWIVLSFINTPLAQLPDSFGLVQVSVLQLLNTALDRLPDDVTPRLSRLRISGRGFQQLPSHLDAPESGELLPRGFFIQDTSVDTLPEWAITWLDHTLVSSNNSGISLQEASLRGSSACTNPEYAKYAPFCKEDAAFDLNTFPYDVIAAQRQL